MDSKHDKKYNVKLFKCFQTQQEYENWMNNNCKACTRLQCYSKRRIRESINFEIPIKRAGWMGCNDTGLLPVCKNFNVPNHINIKGPKASDNFLFKCF